MALSSTFRERLEHMERTRNQRLSLLKAEKELQANKSSVLASKLANIRSMEQRCLVMDQKIASKNFQILALKSEIESLDAKYQNDLQQLRVLRSEVEELEEMERDKDRFYGLKKAEMKAFRENVEKFVVECQVRVEELKDGTHKLKSSFMELQGKNGNLHNSEIAAAEMKKTELLTLKENSDRRLASNYQIRAQLQKQLQSILLTQNEERRKLSQIAENNDPILQSSIQKEIKASN